MPRGSALLTPTLRRFVPLLTAFACLSCRSAVAPPSRSSTDAGFPSGVLSASPGGPLQPDCPRRECPLPVNLIAGLEERMIERLDRERSDFLDGLALLRQQRAAFAGSLSALVARRRAAEAVEADGGGPDVGGDGASCCGDEVRRVAEASTTELLAEIVLWVGSGDGELSIGPATAGTGLPGNASPGGPAAPGEGAPGAGSGAASAGIANAEGAPIREGEWLLPVVRMMARLRARFTAVADAQADVDAVQRALLTAERRLREVLADAAPETPARADLAEALAALVQARPNGCASREGSAVCRPTPVDVWTGSEFTLIAPGDQQDVETVLEQLDQFLSPSPAAPPVALPPDP